MLSGNQPSSGKRLFLGLETSGPWPAKMPNGRIIPENGRHATLVFLGLVQGERLKELVGMTPPPPWPVGLGALATAPLLLPPEKPRCLSWELELLENREQLFAYQESLLSLFCAEGFVTPREKSRHFLPHVTLARAPFDSSSWIKGFTKQFITLGSLHLYESLGGSTYTPLHSWPVIAPAQEMNHTADLAFYIRGQSIQSLTLHAFMALTGVHPPLVRYMPPWSEVESLDDLIACINHSVSRMDIEEGSPFKAVSYHGELKTLGNGVFEWEMIVDV
ncbi:2'-5' RNA ligase family protein [Estrella lausannensis]|uniref:2'-5' RNA ligase n=1 Tax=Estrella lausannensis TaxID=483423 RepID=A0A0H5DSX1_9BACT|nr:hypothetical protein [Estrella lausannensis]CRX39433.1 Conserved hypothetical protein [Estrella lausannensis]